MTTNSLNEILLVFHFYSKHLTSCNIFSFLGQCSCITVFFVPAPVIFWLWLVSGEMVISSPPNYDSICSNIQNIRNSKAFLVNIYLLYHHTTLCNTLVMRNLFIGHQLILNQLILVSRSILVLFLNNKNRLVSSLSLIFPRLFLHVLVTYFLYRSTLLVNLWTNLHSFLFFMCGLLRLLLTSDGNLIPIASIEIFRLMC